MEPADRPVASEEYRRVPARIEHERDEIGVQTGVSEGIFAGSVPDIAGGERATRGPGVTSGGRPFGRRW